MPSLQSVSAQSAALFNHLVHAPSFDLAALFDHALDVFDEFVDIHHHQLAFAVAHVETPAFYFVLADGEHVRHFLQLRIPYLGADGVLALVDFGTQALISVAKRSK